ncbi:MAG: hypothetical protein PVG63_02950 [Anaerolineales bacterium]
MVSISKWLCLAMALISFLLVPLTQTTVAYASGPGTGGRRVRLEGEVAGPYTLRVVTSPTPPRIDNLYVEVRVASAESGEILEDVEVQVLAWHEDQSGPSIQVEATHDIAPIPNEYAAHIPVDETGIWSIMIRVNGELGQGEATFDERISAESILPMLITVGAPVAGLAILIGMFVWLQRNSQSANQDS